MPPAGGTVLMSSRASAELVRKAVRMGAHRLVCLGGATHLAAQWAHQAGLGLAVAGIGKPILAVRGERDRAHDRDPQG